MNPFNFYLVSGSSHVETVAWLHDEKLDWHAIYAVSSTVMGSGVLKVKVNFRYYCRLFCTLSQGALEQSIHKGHRNNLAEEGIEGEIIAPRLRYTITICQIPSVSHHVSTSNVIKAQQQ